MWVSLTDSSYDIDVGRKLMFWLQWLLVIYFVILLPLAELYFRSCKVLFLIFVFHSLNVVKPEQQVRNN